MTAPRLHDGYLHVGVSHVDLAAMGEAARRFAAVLAQAAPTMPEALREFMTAPWHDDPSDRRSLHDMRLRSVGVTEGDGTPGSSGLGVRLVLLGACFDRELTLAYSDVRHYPIVLPPGASRLPHDAHGDLLHDELVPLGEGRFVHALEFSRGEVFEIEFAGTFAYRFDDLSLPPT